MLFIYTPIQELILNEVRIVSNVSSRYLNIQDFSIIFNFDYVSISKKLTIRQFLEIAKIFGMNDFNKLFNVDLLDSPIKCIKYICNNLSGFHIKDTNSYLNLQYEPYDFSNEMSFTEFIQFCEFIKQNLSTSIAIS